MLDDGRSRWLFRSVGGIRPPVSIAFAGSFASDDIKATTSPAERAGTIESLDE